MEIADTSETRGGDDTVAGVIAEWVTGVEWNDVPPAVGEETRKLLVNSVMAAVGAAGLDDPLRVLGMVADEAEPGGSALFLTGKSAPFASAVFANVVLFSSLGQEETHGQTAVHPAEVVLPLLLSWAELHPMKGPELLEALLVGTEAAIQANSFDFLPAVRAEVAETAAIYGAIGAAAAMSKVMGLDVAQTAEAMRIAASCTGGTSECFGAGTSEFHFALASAAELGYRAARLAARGATGSPFAFEGRSGIYRLYGAVPAGELARRDIPADLRARFAAGWRVLEMSYKPHPVHIYNLPFITAASELRAGGDLGARGERVERITIELNAATLAYGANFTGPFSSRDQVVGSTAFLVAAMLVHGRVGLAETQAFDDAAILDLVSRTDVKVAADPTKGLVSVRTGLGERTAAAGFDVGQYRMSVEEILAVHRSPAADVLGDDRAQALIDALMSCDGIDDVGATLVSLLVSTA
jgi:2-methylcitrate dehydratase PrpD